MNYPEDKKETETSIKKLNKIEMHMIAKLC